MHIYGLGLIGIWCKVVLQVSHKWSAYGEDDSYTFGDENVKKIWIKKKNKQIYRDAKNFDNV